MFDAVNINENTGTATCCMAKFDTQRENYLKTANLGDSGYLLIRPLGDGKFEKLFRTKE